MEVREIAFVSLLRCESAKRYTNLEIDSAIKRFQLKGIDRAFYTALVYGVMERKITLDSIIEQLSTKKLSEMDSNVLGVLRLGIYQLLYMDKVPERAACHETTELCKLYSNQGAVGFVNAVMRECCRRKGNFFFPDPLQDPIRYLSVFYSYPEWLCTKWHTCYGMEKTKSILEQMNQHPHFTLRVNTLKITRDALLLRLKERGIEAEETVYSPFGIHIKEYIAISSLQELEEGFCYIQDEASQLCVLALAPQPKESILDACACPGGKSFSCAIEMNDTGIVHSWDLHENKLSLVKKGAEKLGIHCLSILEQNGTQIRPEWIGKIDRVLCDVPCSGLGVIAKKPDIRNKSSEDLERLPDVQYKILNTTKQYVKENGTLVYSTCTLNPAENQEVIAKFLAENLDFTPCDFTIAEKISSDHGMLTLFPDEHGTDGFFIAKLEKRGKICENE